MHKYLSQYWWVFLLRGVLAVIFGILTFAMPHIALASLVIVWGAYAFVDGIFALWSAIAGTTHGDDRWLVGLQGVVGIIAGIITLVMPAITAIGLLIAIAAWILVVGVLQLVAAIKLRKEIEGEFWLGLSGVISILFAFFLIARPDQGALALIWTIGIYAVIFGVALIAFAFRIKSKGSAAAKA
ncbi:HdeD family acid-resistance protein [Aestuariivirga sp.]|uniref:HdeD family acid-resistance protein n=1 Tax=Aestuariivirga sp. TaxID=2650926 RepID=UPI0039E368CC